MGTFILKRMTSSQKNYSVLDAAGNTLSGVGNAVKDVGGSVIKTGGDMMKSGIGQVVGTGLGLAAAKGVISKVGALLPGAATMGFGAKAALTVGSALAGKALAKNVGQSLHNIGNDMKNS